MVAPADPVLRTKARASAASPPARHPAVGPGIVSRFGDISPALAAGFGASVDVGLSLGARNAEARAFSGAARRPRDSAPRVALPTEIATTPALPPSRVRVSRVVQSSDSLVLRAR